MRPPPAPRPTLEEVPAGGTVVVAAGPVVVVAPGTVVVAPGVVVGDVPKGGNGMIWAVVPAPTDAQHGAEEQLGRLPDDLQRPGRVLDAGQLDHHVVPLAADVGLCHAQGIDPLADDGDGLVENAAVDLALGLEHHRRPALEVQAQQGLVAGGHCGTQGDHCNRDDANERVPQ